jgi:hypothetical protein
MRFLEARLPLRRHCLVDLLEPVTNAPKLFRDSLVTTCSIMFVGFIIISQCPRATRQGPWHHRRKIEQIAWQPAKAIGKLAPLGEEPARIVDGMAPSLSQKNVRR